MRLDYYQKRSLLRWLPPWLVVLLTLVLLACATCCKPSYEACQKHYPCEQTTWTEVMPDTVRIGPDSIRTKVEKQYLTRWLRDTVVQHDTLTYENERVRTQLIKEKDTVRIQSDCKGRVKALRRKLKKTQQQSGPRERPGWWERNRKWFLWGGIGLGIVFAVTLAIRFAAKLGL
jgi:hypothetical protein